MGTGYTRQRAAEIDDGNIIQAADLEAEFDQIQAAFNSSTGHTHDGTAGEGPKIALTDGISGILPVANGGTAGRHKLDATTAPTVNADINSSYAVGSLWIDVTNDLVYVCVDNTLGAAVWKRMQVQSNDIDAIIALAKTDGNFIVGDGTSWVAESGSTVRTSLGLGSAAVATLIDDDSFATATSTNIPSAESVKEYVDANSVLDAELTALASVTSAANKLPYFTGSGTAAVTDLSSYGRSLIDDADATTARATLGVTIGTDVQAYDSGLTSIAALTTGADKMLYTTGSDNYAVTDLTAFGRSLLDDGSATAARTTLGLVIGTNVQAYDAELAALAGLTSAADKLPYFTGSGTAALADMTSFARTVLDDNDAATARATLGVTIGTDVQAYNSGLADVASLAKTDDNIIVGNGTNWVAESGATARTSLGLGTSNSPQFTAIELGHATDTTLTRAAAGFIAVEGNRVPSPASQAAGDILYRGSTEWDRLPKGTAGQVLTMNAGATAPEWQAGTSVPSQTQAVWDAGTDTTESKISAAKLKAAILTHAPGDTYNQPTSSTLPVGTCALLFRSTGVGGNTNNGATLSGSSLVSPRNQSAATWGAGGATQAGTWRNISGGTLSDGGYGYWVRES
jgi:hypothetical protein